MLKFLFSLIVSIFLFSGCTALKSGDSFEEGSYDTQDESEEFTGSEEDYAEGEDEFVEDEEEGYEGDAEGEGGEDEEEFAEEEGEKKGGISGFFSRLFGGDSEEEEEYTEEGEYTEGDENFVEGGEEDYVEEDSMDEEVSSASSEEVVQGEENLTTTDTANLTTANMEETSTPSVTEPEKPSFIPLNKILKTAYKKSGYLINAVYIARENDTLALISEKIYGSDRVSELYAINPHLQSRSVKVGDKIYYNSPFRPEDSSRLLFYYEDIKAPGSSYTLSAGDNIRSVASQLLGHPNSWKEIWATNPNLESKGEVLNNINIVYWPQNTVAQAPQASSPEPVLEETLPVESPTPAEEPVNSEEIPPQPEQIANPADFPEPPPVQKKSQPGLLQVLLAKKEIAFGLIGVIVILILMIRWILKKRKQRDFDYTATNIEV